MTKLKKIIISLFSIIFGLAAISGLGYTTYALIKNYNADKNNKPESNLNVLNKSKVNTLFSEGNIWYNKTLLLASDFVNFDAIDTNCFDDLNFILDQVELPLNIEIKNQFNAIKWNNVKNITISKSVISNKKSTELEIFNNLLIYNNGSRKYILTIANRNLEIDNLIFPNSKNFNNDKFISISDNFYDEQIFQNIKKITIYSDIICNIGANAFKNCQILSDQCYLETYDKNIIIGDNSFFNSNLSWISMSSSKLIMIGTEAFSNSKLSSLIIDYANNAIIWDNAFYNASNLSNIIISSRNTFISNSSFKNCNKTLSIFIYSRGWTYDNMLTFGDEILANNYDALSIMIRTERSPISLIKSENALSNINIDPANFKFSIDTLSGLNSSDFKDLGLNQELINKIEFIDEN